jgi:hypothetical protein
VSAPQRIPRRDIVPLWAVGGWFYGALCCLILAVEAPRVIAETVVFVGGWFIGVGLWRLIRVRRNPLAGPHRELLAVLRSLPGGRINRDERVVFTYQVKGRLPLIRTVTVIRVPEDDVLALQAEGSADLVVHSWQVSPWEYGITRGMHGTRITEADVEKGVVEFERTGFWQWQKHQRAARKAGMLHASADEVRALIDALRDSEPMSPQDEP